MDRGVPLVCVAGGHVEGTVLIAWKNHRTYSELDDINIAMKQFEGNS